MESCQGKTKWILFYAVCHYKGNTLSSVYDLTAYDGAGEGYMPVKDGLMRHYDAIGLAK